MPFPDGLPTPRVHYAITSPVAGVPARGSVKLMPNVPAIVVDGYDIQFTGSGTYRLDGGELVDTEGNKGVRLLPCDLAGSNPEGWMWTAIVSVEGQATRTVYFHLSASDGDVDLAEIQQLDPGTPDYVAVPGPQGPQGPTGPQGPQGPTGPTGADGTAAVTAHAADTTDVHGIADTSVLETQSGAQAKATAAQAAAISAAAADATTKAGNAQSAAAAALSAHEADTTGVHGISDTAVLETQSGAQGKADAAQAAAISAAAADATTKAGNAQSAATSAAASALSGHDADTTGVHGIADTAALETQSGAQSKASAAQTAATSAAAADATSKVSAHTVASDPHGDRAYADSTKLAKSGGTVTGDLTVSGALNASGFVLPAIPRSTQRPVYRPASWSQIFQTGHGWSSSGSGVGSSNMNDTANFCKGTQSAQVTTTGTGAVANIRRLASALPDLTGKALRLTFRVADVTHLNQINVQVGTSTTANTFSWRLHTHAASAENQVLSGEWVTMVLSWADVRSTTGTYSISANGVPSTTTGFTDFVFQVVDDNTANPVVVNLQAVEIVPDTTETFPNGVVSITFDDSYASQYTYARPKMDALGYRGTLYTICENIDTAQYLTLSQLQSVQNQSGWEVAGHAYYSANHNAKYNALSAAVVEDDIRRTRMWMIANGFSSDNFAYPGGYFSKSSDGIPIEPITCRYFSSGRGISGADNLESFPPVAPYRMRSITGIGSLAGGSAKGLPANLTGAGGSLDRCQLDGSWVILTFHEIVTGTAATSNQCSQTDFNTIMDAIASRSIPVRPVGDVLRLYS
jgi:peptidoglycan/xylan/chitin deacetylase (PgdA/CDA1 family)